MVISKNFFLNSELNAKKCSDDLQYIQEMMVEIYHANGENEIRNKPNEIVQQ